jgi:hypothetical protein
MLHCICFSRAKCLLCTLRYSNNVLFIKFFLAKKKNFLIKRVFMQIHCCAWTLTLMLDYLSNSRFFFESRTAINKRWISFKILCSDFIIRRWKNELQITPFALFAISTSKATCLYYNYYYSQKIRQRWS